MLFELMYINPLMLTDGLDGLGAPDCIYVELLRNTSRRAVRRLGCILSRFPVDV